VNARAGANVATARKTAIGLFNPAVNLAPETGPIIRVVWRRQAASQRQSTD